MINLLEETELDSLDSKCKTSKEICSFRVMTYNLLAQSGLRRDHFEYTSNQCLKWNYRKNLLLKQLATAEADIICVQECDEDKYNTFWKSEMQKHGFSSTFKGKTTQQMTYGCGIFWKLKNLTLSNKKIWNLEI